MEHQIGNRAVPHCNSVKSASNITQVVNNKSLGVSVTSASSSDIWTTKSSNISTNTVGGTLGPTGPMGQIGPRGIPANGTIRMGNGKVEAYNADDDKWVTIAGVDETNKLKEIKDVLRENFPEALFDLMMRGLL